MHQRQALIRPGKKVICNYSEGIRKNVSFPSEAWAIPDKTF